MCGYFRAPFCLLPSVRFLFEYKVAVISSLMVIVSYSVELCELTVAKAKSSQTIMWLTEVAAFCVETLWTNVLEKGGRGHLSNTFRITSNVDLLLLFVHCADLWVFTTQMPFCSAVILNFSITVFVAIRAPMFYHRHPLTFTMFLIMQSFFDVQVDCDVFFFTYF